MQSECHYLSLHCIFPELTFGHPADILQLIEIMSASAVICKLIYYLSQTSQSNKLLGVATYLLIICANIVYGCTECNEMLSVRSV